jgi:NAD(P)-dependent dehydrogenase (short-subunit alcohol dehydrogenase family)
MEYAKNRVILVTGASGGTGKSIATLLATEGHTVFGTSRRVQMEDSGFRWIKMDVCQPVEIQKAVEEIIALENRIDVLINNAGIGMISSFEEAPEANIRQVMDTNFGGIWRLSQAVLPYMRRQRSGKIINISSIAGLMGLPYRSIYCASKFAVEGLTESIRTEVTPFNIQVCSIQPGDIRTDIKSNRVSYIPADSPYQPLVSSIEQKVNTEVDQGVDPEAIALLISKLIDREKLKSKYVVATPFQKLGSSLKRYLPRQLFEQLLMNQYRLK